VYTVCLCVLLLYSLYSIGSHGAVGVPSVSASSSWTTLCLWSTHGLTLSHSVTLVGTRTLCDVVVRLYPPLDPYGVGGVFMLVVVLDPIDLLLATSGYPVDLLSHYDAVGVVGLSHYLVLGVWSSYLTRYLTLSHSHTLVVTRCTHGVIWSHGV
jgi:hypothetical protein